MIRRSVGFLCIHCNASRVACRLCQWSWRDLFHSSTPVWPMILGVGLQSWMNTYTDIMCIVPPGKIDVTSLQWPFQEPKLEVPTICKAYVRGYPPKIWPYMVQYLQFRILEFPLITQSLDICESRKTQYVKLIPWRTCSKTKKATTASTWTSLDVEQKNMSWHVEIRVCSKIRTPKIKWSTMLFPIVYGPFDAGLVDNFQPVPPLPTPLGLCIGW